MNEIVSTKEDNNLDGYKLVYPNKKGLKVALYNRNNENLFTKPSESSYLRFFESLFNSTAIFIEKYEYDSILKNLSNYRIFELVFSSLNNELLKEKYIVRNIKVLNKKYQTVNVDYPKKIKEIYFNTEDDTVAIVLDSKLCSKHEKRQTAKLKIQETFSNNVKDLLN